MERRTDLWLKVKAAGTGVYDGSEIHEAGRVVCSQIPRMAVGRLRCGTIVSPLEQDRAKLARAMQSEGLKTQVTCTPLGEFVG